MSKPHSLTGLSEDNLSGTASFSGEFSVLKLPTPVILSEKEMIPI